MTYHRLLFLFFLTCCMFKFLRGQFDAIPLTQDWALVGSVIQSISSTTLAYCFFECTKNIQCYSINFYLSKGQCELSKSTGQYNPRFLHNHGNAMYLQYRTTVDCQDELCNVAGGLRCFIENNQRTCRVCKSPLGMEDGRIPDSALSASSNNADNVLQPTWGRLNSAFNGWAPKEGRRGEWLQVDLAKVIAVTMVATQGKQINTSHKWVTKYKISASSDAFTWFEYKENGVVKVFNGNSDANTIVTNAFKEKILARYIRLIVWEWKLYIQLRMELYGCPT